MSDGTGERATAVGVTLWCGSVTHRKLLFLLGVLVHSAFFFFLLSFFLSFFLFDLFLIWKMLYLFIWFSFFWFCCGLERAWAAAGIWPEMKTNGNSIREDANYPKDPDFLSWFAGCMRPPSLLPHPPPPPPPSIVAFNCPIKLIWRDHSQVAWCSNGAAGNQIVGWLRRRHRGAMCWSCPASNQEI